MFAFRRTSRLVIPGTFVISASSPFTPFFFPIAVHRSATVLTLVAVMTLIHAIIIATALTLMAIVTIVTLIHSLVVEATAASLTFVAVMALIHSRTATVVVTIVTFVALIHIIRHLVVFFLQVALTTTGSLPHPVLLLLQFNNTRLFVFLFAPPVRRTLFGIGGHELFA